MDDGWGTGAGTGSDDGRQGPSAGWPPPGTDEGGRPVLEGNVIPSKPRSAMPPLYQSRQQDPAQPEPGQGGTGQGGTGQGGTGQGGVGQQGQQEQPGWHAQPGQGLPGGGGVPGQGGGEPHQAPWRPPGQPGDPAARREPDWDALASANAGSARKRRFYMIGGGVLAAVVVVAIVTVAVGQSGGSKPDADPSPSTSAPTSEPQFPDVTPPPAASPLDFISSAAKDTAPLSADTIFIGKRMSIGSRSYTLAGKSATRSCAAVTQGDLGAALSANGCREMFRATYLREGKAATVGIAVFDDAKTAKAAVNAVTKGNVAAMAGDGVGTFCRPVACWSTSNTVGRYAYFTIAGPDDNKPAQSSDTLAEQAGRDAGTFAFNRLVQRGKDAAASGG